MAKRETDIHNSPSFKMSKNFSCNEERPENRGGKKKNKKTLMSSQNILTIKSRPTIL